MNLYAEKFFRVAYPVAVASVFVDFNYRVAGYLMRPMDVLIAVLFCMIPLIKERERNWFKFNAIDFFVIVYLMFRIFHSYTMPYFPSEAPKKAIQTIEFVMLYIIGKKYFSSPERAVFGIKALVVCYGLNVAITVLYHIAVGKFYNYKYLNESKHAFGVFATLCSVWFLKTWKSSLFWLMLVSVILLFLSGERKGWLALAFAITVVGFAMLMLKSLSFNKIILAVSVLVLNLTILVVVYILLPEGSYLDRQLNSFSELGENITSEGIYYQDAESISNQGRMQMLDQTLYELSQKPFLGNGIGYNMLWNMHGDLNVIGVDYGGIGLFLYLVPPLVAILLLMGRHGRTCLKFYWDGYFILGYAACMGVIVQFLGGGGVNLMCYMVSLSLISALCSRPFPGAMGMPYYGHPLGYRR